jgi:predicted RNase H-like nuclease (RuvC/YqgF family)
MIDSSIIFGLDILARSNKDKGSTLFSLAVLSVDHLDKYPKINRRTLFKKIFNIKPDFIAMDNIFELTPNAQGIIRFLEKIPPMTTLVQVTGNPRTGMEKLSNLIRKHRLKKELSFPFSPQKLNSIETAEICAVLCQKHVGHEVVAFEEEIRITVSKKKSHGRGGWSAPRYERISKVAVHQSADEVELILREKGISWEVLEYPQRRVYFVQLEKKLIPEIQNKMKPLTTDLVRVKVERISKSNLDFQPLDVTLAPASRPLRNIVLGIDPGTTTGIAVLDLISGNVLYLGSKRECGISEIIRVGSKYGKISCVTADVIPPPATVEKVARMTGAKLLTPKILASAAQKREYLHDYRDLTVNYGHLNSHERDALFGALKAFNTLKEQLIKIERIIRESHPKIISQLPEIQRLVLVGNSISNAINLVYNKQSLLESSKTENGQEALVLSLKQEQNQLQTKIEVMYEELNKLDQEAIYWRRQSREKASEIKKLKDKLEKNSLKRADQLQKRITEAVTREVNRIREENQEIRRTLRENQQEMEKLKQIKTFWVQGREIPLKVIKTFSESSIRETKTRYGLNDGDIVLVLDPSGGGAQTAQILIDLGIRGVIVPEDTAKFSDQALNQFKENCVAFLTLPLIDFSSRIIDGNKSRLGLWVYDGLYLTDVSIKEEIRKLEIKLREELRKKRRSLVSRKNYRSNTAIYSERDIQKILDDFKEEYISQYSLNGEEEHEDSNEEE